MESEIIEIEEAVRAAQLSGDVAFLEKTLADDFKFITPQGKIISKQDDLDQYRSGQLKMSKVEVLERTIYLYGSTAVVRFQVTFEGMAAGYRFSTVMVMTRVYVKSASGWQMVAGHSSEMK